MNADSAEPHAFDESCRLIIELGTVAHGYGVSSIRLEAYLTRVTRALGLQGEFIVTPSDINFIFSREADARQHSHFSRMAASSFDMAKLAQVGELVDQVEAGTLSGLVAVGPSDAREGAGGDTRGAGGGAEQADRP